MKKIIPGMLLLVFAITANAQISDPVRWTFSSKKLPNKTYELHFTASINMGWHLYGQGPGATGLEPTTSINFIRNPVIQVDGKVLEMGKPEQYYDKNFKSVLKYYTNTVDFVQKIKLNPAVATVVKGTASYVVCNDRACLPTKDVPFSIPVGGK